MKFCDECGAKLEDVAVFCDECGNKVEDVIIVSKENDIIGNKKGLRLVK